MSQDVFIAAGARTPMGGLQGDLSSLTAVELGEAAIEPSLPEQTLTAQRLMRSLWAACYPAAFDKDRLDKPPSMPAFRSALAPPPSTSSAALA